MQTIDNNTIINGELLSKNELLCRLQKLNINVNPNLGLDSKSYLAQLYNEVIVNTDMDLSPIADALSHDQVVLRMQNEKKVAHRISNESLRSLTNSVSPSAAYDFNLNRNSRKQVLPEFSSNNSFNKIDKNTNDVNANVKNTIFRANTIQSNMAGINPKFSRGPSGLISSNFQNMETPRNMSSQNLENVGYTNQNISSNTNFPIYNKMTNTTINNSNKNQTSSSNNLTNVNNIKPSTTLVPPQYSSSISLNKSIKGDIFTQNYKKESNKSLTRVQLNPSTKRLTMVEDTESINQEMQRKLNPNQPISSRPSFINAPRSPIRTFSNINIESIVNSNRQKDSSDLSQFNSKVIAGVIAVAIGAILLFKFTNIAESLGLQDVSFTTINDTITSNDFYKNNWKCLVALGLIILAYPAWRLTNQGTAWALYKNIQSKKLNNTDLTGEKIMKIANEEYNMDKDHFKTYIWPIVKKLIEEDVKVVNWSDIEIEEGLWMGE